MKYLSLKIRSEPHIQIFKMATLLPPGHCTTNHSWNLSPSRFWSENVTFLREYDVIIGDSLPKFGETPWKLRFQPISSRNVHPDNQTIPVLLRTSFKYRFHPPCSPPYSTPLPHPLTQPFLAPTPCPFLQPLPPTIFAPSTAKSKSPIKNS